ncbi:hypothetical protein [uncultured Mucilaginibacter sp.]|uniref:hypothetical protein n=1 Tax=uncultured Mucilaginibacter sp. TaxID=797541 RepID=UPI0025F80A7B|nr:hypothetical protein [uncultured Mucilaginibacter sp.]
MKHKLLAFVFAAFLLPLQSWTAPSGEKTIAAGNQPQISTDEKGIIRVVYGHEDMIFCATSTDKGETFSNPVLVATVPKMHLGMSRGPQLTSSTQYSIITAQDETGNIHWYQLNNSSGQWKSMGIVNDLKGSAPEGLMGISSDKKDHFYAVWLDTRAGGGNNIYFSSLSAKTAHWSKNRLVYRSPDKLVCGCCKPNIAVQGSEVAIMFRNWLNGSRDLYLLKSSNGGASFAAAQKLGTDTWKLNGCPMDGGGVTIDASNVIRTTWQRKGMVYFCQPGEKEVNMGYGKNCAISAGGPNPVLTFENRDTVKVLDLKNKNGIAVGNGSFIKSVVIPGNKILCVWEQDNKIKFKKV